MMGTDHIKTHYWGYIMGIIGILIVSGYLVFEYLVYHEFLEDVIDRPLEHFVIFSIVPLSAALGYAVDRKIQAERQILRNRYHAETIISNIGEGVLELDQDFRVFSVNDYVLDIVKMKRNEIVGKTCYEVFHGLQEVCPDCPVKVTFDTGKPSYTAHEGRAKNGTKTYVEMNSYPIKNPSGEVISVIETVKEVSERRRHEKEMKEKRELEKITKHAIDRELKMVELKKEIKELKERLKTS
ncbi:MAG: PAS domain-containing protein [Candidatus Hydrothermarchaeales archaeon]